MAQFTLTALNLQHLVKNRIYKIPPLFSLYPRTSNSQYTNCALNSSLSQTLLDVIITTNTSVDVRLERCTRVSLSLTCHCHAVPFPRNKSYELVQQTRNREGLRTCSPIYVHAVQCTYMQSNVRTCSPIYPESLTDSREIASKKSFLSKETSGEAVRVVSCHQSNI